MYSKTFSRWDITEDTFRAGMNARRIRRWLRLYAPNGRICVSEYEGQMFALLASRLRNGRLMAAVHHLSGGSGYEVNLTEFKN